METPEEELKRLRSEVQELTVALETTRQNAAASEGAAAAVAVAAATAAATGGGASLDPDGLRGGEAYGSDRRQSFGVTRPLPTGVVRLATTTLPASPKFPKSEKKMDFMEERQAHLAWLTRFKSHLRREGLAHVIV
ncbi:unnamed protein product, partial [Pylaiella littoralis]